jgi:hypothetical protein
MSHSRAYLSAIVTLTSFLLCSIPATAWADGAEKTKAPASKPDGIAAEPPKGDAGEIRVPPAIEHELSELKEELSAQRAALEAQQSRIAKLEAQLHLSTAQPAKSASESTLGIAEDSITPLSASGFAASAAVQSGASQLKEKKTSPLSFELGPAKFTPGGWADLTGIFRTTDIGSGTGTNFSSIPFNNTLPQAALSEFRFTAQTSRLSMRVDIPASDTTHVTGYVESDFNGFQPPNAYISTNSSTFRLRLAWGRIQHGKWDILGGQSWSLLTPNRVGLSPFPADVFTSYRLDTNYLAGLTYARQAGFRAVYHATDWWTLGASLENAQQYVPSSVVFPGTAGFFAGQFDNGSGATNAGSATTNPAIPNLHPDVIVKTAFDWKLGERAFHLEAAGLIRSFKVFNNLATPSETNTATAVSGSINLNFELLKNFHLIANSFYGEGGGRYIGGLGPDVVVKPNGTISPLHSGSGVAGFEWDVFPRLVIESYYSGAYFSRNFGLLPSSATPPPSCDGVSGFTCVGFGFPGSANTNNRAIQAGTFGFTQTLWGSPKYGKLQFITQSSYVVRSPWSVASGSPKNAHAFLEYVDLRYILP